MIGAALAAALAVPGTARPATGKEVVGWIQNVAFQPSGLILRAKMDSGAKTASLHVTQLEEFPRNSHRWVRFRVTNANGHAVAFERPVERVVRVKREGGRLRSSPVVRLRICLGAVAKDIEVGLNDRTGFNYQLLVGRRFLAGDFLIDPGRTFVSPPHCDRGG